MTSNDTCTPPLCISCHSVYVMNVIVDIVVWLNPSKDLEKKIFSRFFMNLARNQAKQDFHLNLEQESWQVSKFAKILASAKSWHEFGTDFLPTCQFKDLARHI